MLTTANLWGPRGHVCVVHLHSVRKNSAPRRVLAACPGGPTIAPGVSETQTRPAHGLNDSIFVQNSSAILLIYHYYFFKALSTPVLLFSESFCEKAGPAVSPDPSVRIRPAIFVHMTFCRVTQRSAGSYKSLTPETGHQTLMARGEASRQGEKAQPRGTATAGVGPVAGFQLRSHSPSRVTAGQPPSPGSLGGAAALGLTPAALGTGSSPSGASHTGLDPAAPSGPSTLSAEPPRG